MATGCDRIGHVTPPPGGGSRARARGLHRSDGMTIQPPPDDEMPPPTPIDTTDETPVDQPDPEAEQRAPGQDQRPMGAPRDEPDPQMA